MDTIIKVSDMHGFPLEVTLEEAVTLQQVEERAREQSRAWWAYEGSRGAGWFTHSAVEVPFQPPLVTNFGSLAGTSLTLASNVGLLKKLIRKGVPPALRPKVWRVVSGAARKQAAVPQNYFQEILQEVDGKETPATRQIDNDLHRTYPGHPWLGTAQTLTSLRRVLVAYSWRDSRVGYCQGMNFVAAYLLLVMKTEEDAFWMLATLLEDVLYNDCYSENLFGCHVELRVLKDLLAKKLPKLAAHLQALNCDLALVTTEWFLCLFAKSLPTETTMRVWDVLFNEGAKVLFRVALAIFKMHEAELLQASHVGEVIRLLQEATRHAYHPDALLKVAFERVGSMSMKSISRQRLKQQGQVMDELQERVRKMGQEPAPRAGYRQR